MKCQYCLGAAELVTGAEVYPHLPGLRYKKIWRCEPCKAWVGCHEGTENAMGRLANAELRQAKMDAHAAFDPLWREGDRTRKQAYQWLADKLGMPFKKCHIGYFSVEQCKQVINVCGEVIHG
jgi:hypothetical protein